jgi:hypothetical protein
MPKKVAITADAVVEEPPALEIGREHAGKEPPAMLETGRKALPGEAEPRAGVDDVEQEQRPAEAGGPVRLEASARRRGGLRRSFHSSQLSPP